MNKISNAQVAEVLTDAASALREQAATISGLEDKLASYERRGRAVKLANAMHDKGLGLDTSVADLIESLEKAAEANKLDVIEQAVELAGPDMGSKLAELTNDGPGSSLSASDLERFIVGTAG